MTINKLFTGKLKKGVAEIPIAVLILLIIARYRRQNDLTSSSTPQDVLSSIPAEDSEDSACPLLLPCSHAPRRFSFVEVSSIHLPDYFTAVQSTESLYSSDVPDTPPPCYDEVVEMTISANTASEEETHSS
ncbi:hypothetical protein ACROYT_G034885 [Oculina patagonica]